MIPTDFVCLRLISRRGSDDGASDESDSDNDIIVEADEDEIEEESEDEAISDDSDDDDSAGLSDDDSEGGDSSKLNLGQMTARKRRKLQEEGNSNAGDWDESLIALPMDESNNKKKKRTAEEEALRRIQQTQKRKILSDKKDELIKKMTIEKLLRRQVKDDKVGLIRRNGLLFSLNLTLRPPFTEGRGSRRTSNTHQIPVFLHYNRYRRRQDSADPGLCADGLDGLGDFP